MWEIFEDKRLVSLLAQSTPIEVIKRYEKWKDVVRFSGPLGLRSIRGFRDEALAGQWKGYRSCRLGIQWRVIYQVKAATFSVYVERVSAHNYKKD
jgi:addiction module RelE/StbE family toxin